MTSPRGRKLKVFQTQVGFYDVVVAVSSQAAALEAWGTHQNLFADGQAKLATDEAAIKVALSHPETPLRRAVGSSDAFAIEPTSLPKIPDRPKKDLPKPKVRANAAATPKPPADRSKLDAAEADLRKIGDRRQREEASFRENQAALTDEIANAQASYVRERKAATAAMILARKAYRAAGGY